MIESNIIQLKAVPPQFKYDWTKVLFLVQGEPEEDTKWLTELIRKVEGMEK